MDLRCSKCGRILIKDIPDYNVQSSAERSIHLCENCSEKLGLNICGCGRIMEITNTYIINECECGSMTRRENR